MARRPLTGLLSQYSKVPGGAAADGYWLKLYTPNTTTPKSMYTLQSGGALLDKCKLNTRGEPINNVSDDDSTFIPYSDSDYDAYLFQTEADADANNTNDATFLGQNIQGDLVTVEQLNDSAFAQFSTVSDLISGQSINLGSIDWSQYLGRDVTTVINNTSSGRGGASYTIVDADPGNISVLSNGIWMGANHALGNGYYAKLKIDGDVNVLFFGAVADGTLGDATLNPSPTDNRRAFVSACDYLRRNVYAETQGGKIVFPQYPNQSYATSGEIPLPEGVIHGYNTRITPIGNPECIFRLDLRHNTNTRRFTKNFIFSGFICHTDRGFGVPTQSTDMSHLLIIDGGWLIRSRVSDLDCAPGFACKSVVHWDLTHTDIASGVTEVGVPDSISFINISAQYSENTSYAISFSGDTLGTLSRASSIEFKNIYNSIRNGYSFTDRSTGTEDFGGVRLDDVKIGRSRVDEIFSRNAINQFNESSVSSTKFVRLYNEYNYQTSPTFECVLRGGEYSNCVFDDVSLYSENSNLTDSPRLFDADFNNCEFHTVWFNFNSKLTNPPTQNTLNLGANSSQCKFYSKPIYVGTFEGAGLPWILKNMTVNNDTQLLFLNSYCEISTETIVSGDGSYLIGRVENDLCELNANVSLKCFVRAGSGVTASLNLRISGDGVVNDRSSPALAYDSTNSAASFEVEFCGRSDTVVSPAYNEFSNSASYAFTTIHGNNISVESLNNLTIQFNSGEYDIYLDVSGMSPSGDLAVRMNSLCIGYSSEYVNIV